MSLEKKLIEAASCGNLNKVSELLKAYDLDDGSKICTRSMAAKRAKLQPMPEELQYDLLSEAISKSHLDVVKLFISKGFPLNYDFQPSRPAMLVKAVIFSEDETMIKELLLNGAYVNGEATFFIQQSNGEQVVTEVTALHLAINEGKEDAVKMLLDFGANANACDSDLDTPMHYAALKNNLQIPKILIDKGSTLIHSANSNGLTPIHCAALLGHKDLFEFLLLNLTENPSFIPIMGKALYCAAERNHHDIVDIILNNGIDVNVLISSDDGFNETALHKAAYFGHYKAAKLLIERGADVHITDPRGATVMHCIASGECEDLRVAELLLQHGANINARDNNQHTPLHYASELGNKLLFELLLDHGADILAEDEDGVVALDITLEKNYQHKSELLISRLIKLYSNDSIVCAKYLEMLRGHPNLLLLWKDCLKEMQVMKDERINETNVTFFDIMSSVELTKLAFYARNDSIKKVFESVFLNLQFPIYCSSLYKAYAVGKNRRNLEDKARLMFCSLLDKNDQCLPKLPVVVTSQIISYLCNDDLIHFTTM